MDKGFLISFEGGEGGGKSTQVLLLHERLKREGFSVTAARDNGGTVIGEQIREVLLSTKNVSMSYRAEALLLQASRAQSYEEVVLPALETGNVVLMDRTRDSSLVYQGVLRGFGTEFIELLNDFSTQKTMPDLTFLLDVDVETGIKRREQVAKLDRFEVEQRDFHEKIRKTYLEIAKKDTSGRWITINADEPVDSVQEIIWQHVAKILEV